MAINDVDMPGSDGWWMEKCWLELKAKRPHLTMLENYRRGTPPIAMGSTRLSSGFYRFQQQARTNVSDLAVQALIERLGVRTIHTAASTDTDGDVKATNMLQSSGLLVVLSDIFRHLATYGQAFGSACAPNADGSWSRACAEDPRECVVLTDSATGEPVAAFKLYHDILTGYDYAILWRPGRKVVAYSPKGTAPRPEARDRQLRVPRIAFVPSKFTVRPVRDDAGEYDPNDPTVPLFSENYDGEDIPVIQFNAPDGVGVFERHIDLVDQINHIILQGLVIATLQAFRQKALKLKEPLPDVDPKTGEKINYDDLFSADPGALWELPLGAEIWESGQVEMTGILQQAKDAIQRFASNTRTPFSMFISDAINQSAEGAQLAREGLVFKAEDYHRIVTVPLLSLVSLLFKFMPADTRYADGTANSADRADLTGMSIDWLPAERYSLAEKAAADAATKTLSYRQKAARIWGLSPAEVDTNMAELNEDQLRGLLANTNQPPTPPTPTGAPGDIAPATG